MGPEATAAADNQAAIRRDMLSRCCRSAATTWPITGTAWLSMDRRVREVPRIYPRELVPQGRELGKFAWPGFGENMRVLQVDRRSRARSRTRSFNRRPVRLHADQDLNWTGLPFSAGYLAKIMSIDPGERGGGSAGIVRSLWADTCRPKWKKNGKPWRRRRAAGRREVDHRIAKRKRRPEAAFFVSSRDAVFF